MIGGGKNEVFEEPVWSYDQQINHNNYIFIQIVTAKYKENKNHLHVVSIDVEKTYDIIYR